MEKFLNVAHVYGLNTISFNPLLLVPVVIVLIGAVAVFITLRKPESQKFHKINYKKNSSSSNNDIVKKKKRSTPLELTIQTTNHVKGLATKSEILKKKESHVAVKKEKTNIIVEKAQAKKLPNKNAKSKDSKMKTKIDKKEQKDAQSSMIVADKGDGEWQTVIGKKQKVKQTDETVFPAKVTKGKTKKDNTNTNIKFQPSEQSKQVETIKKDDIKPKVSNEVDVEKIEGSTIEEKEPTTNTIESMETVLMKQQISATNVVFDEFEDNQEDPGWMETKPAKKNKKRAIRE